MKKSKMKFYFTTFFLIQILVYFFKIDRDVFAFQEYVCQQNQTYTEQPLSKIGSYFVHSISISLQFSNKCIITNHCATNWNHIFISYNLKVYNLLCLNEFISGLTIKTIAILHKQNIHHMSSEDEELGNQFLA